MPDEYGCSSFDHFQLLDLFIGMWGPYSIVGRTRVIYLVLYIPEVFIFTGHLPRFHRITRNVV